MPRLRLQDRFNCDCVIGAARRSDRYTYIDLAEARRTYPEGPLSRTQSHWPVFHFETHPSTRSTEIPVAKSVSLEVLINPRRRIFFRAFMSFEGGPRCCVDRYININLRDLSPFLALRLFLSRNTIYKCKAASFYKYVHDYMTRDFCMIRCYHWIERYGISSRTL